MKNKNLIGIFLIIVSSGSLAESIPVNMYQDKDGLTILTNKEISNPNLKLVKSTQYKLDSSPDG